MNSRLLAAAVLAAVALSCSSRYHPQSVSTEAAGLFARADQAGAGGSLVLDFEVMRELGFLNPEQNGDANAAVDMLLYALPGIAAEGKDEAFGQLAARAAVLVALMRDWAVWPRAQRFGLFVAGSAAQPDMQAIMDNALMVLAVKGDLSANSELLKGLAAMDRAGGQPQLKLESGDLCLAKDELPAQVCIKAGNGYFALGTAQSLKGIAAPASGAALPTAAGPMAKLKLDMPGMGKGELLIDGHSSLTVSAVVNTADPKMAEQLEKMANEGLKALDESREKTRKVMGPALEQTKQALASDAEAPQVMKAAASRLTLDTLLDPKGEYAALRQSLKVARNGAEVKGELTVPESQLKRFTQGGSMMTAVAVSGIAAAVAIPNFMKYQCRSKQAEAKANLKSAWVAQKAFFQEKDRYGESFEEIGFQPEMGNRYTYCMRGQCLPCSHPSCTPPNPMENPCFTMTMTQAASDNGGVFICAAADLDDKGSYDVWTINDLGQPSNRTNGCR